ncbi:MAG: hypothetical protein Q4G70_05440 [Pseudomonadota bacterium]|nr:hypothetical protein [Pseudomonadota bacterium]
MTAWQPCPYVADYRFDVGRVRALWPALHAVDAEPLPESDALWHAWALFHSGRFEQAADAGLAVGLAGWSVANRATAAHAALVEPHESARVELFKRIHARAVTHTALQPHQANAWYWQGYALAHYAQGIHVARALAQGLGAQVRTALEATLALAPGHAYAHVALGGFHAAVIDKVGPLVGAITYGARTDAALAHVAEARRLAPNSPAVLVECAHTLERLGGDERLAEAARLQEQAAQLPARDAVERLWVEVARTEL